MTRKEMIELIIMKMSDDDVRRLSFRYTGDDSGLSLEKLLLAENSMHQALALAALKDWVMDERIFFYTTPMGDGKHHAHFGVNGHSLYEIESDSEYWALAHTLTIAIKDNKFPIQEDVQGKIDEALNIREKVRQLEHKLDAYEGQRRDVRNRLAFIREHMEDLFRATEQREETF